MSDILSVIEHMEVEVENAETMLQQVRHNRQVAYRTSVAWGQMNTEAKRLAAFIKKTNHDIKLLRKEVKRLEDLKRRSSGK